MYIENWMFAPRTYIIYRYDWALEEHFMSALKWFTFHLSYINYCNGEYPTFGFVWCERSSTEAPPIWCSNHLFAEVANQKTVGLKGEEPGNKLRPSIG